MTDARTLLDRIGDERRRLAAMHGCTEDLLPFKLEGEPGYSTCRGDFHNEYCGGCDLCLLMQWNHSFTTQVSLI